ncbi:MAG: serine/threonine-protein kinase [Burkholderiales bacterium]
MLAARAQVQHNGFLGALPPLKAPPPEPPVAAWAEGSRIGPYRLARHLGEGGMAEVWMAQRDDGAFQRTVAIKLLFRNAGSSERDSFAQRFARERDILASLDHPHIAGLHDAGVTPTGQPWLALEYIEGETLTRWCDTQRLGIEARVRLFRQVLMAVQHAHANLVIHRDLKPANILVTAQGEVRLLDFGIAKLMEPEGGALVESELTRMAGRPMTPQYAAPEQLLGQPLTTACDVYALGVVLYELLCGERPYELKLDSAAQLEQSILDVEPRSPSRRALTEAAVQARGTTSVALHRALASDLDAIVLRALAKQPAQRYSSAEAFRADLDHWLAGEPVEARVPSAAYRLRKFALRHRLAVALSVGAVLSLIGITAVAVVMGLQAREDSARAGAARDFMLGLFKRADQEKARGADITARELLETGRRDVLVRMAAQPRLQAELLQGIGTIQKDMGEYVDADRTYAHAAKIYGQLGMARDAALTLTAQANALMRKGDIARAKTVLQQARETPGWLRDDAELNARANEVDGWIAYLQGDMRLAQVLFLQCHREALVAFGPYNTKTMDALRGRLYAEQESHNFVGALQLLEQLETTAAKTIGVGARELAALAIERADLLLFSGRYSELLDHAVIARAKCVSELGPDQDDCRKLLVRKMNVMLRLGMSMSASDERASLGAIADDKKSPSAAAEALLLMLKLDSETRPGERQALTFGRVKSLVEAAPEAALSRYLTTRATLALAESDLRVGAVTDADRWIQGAWVRLRQDGVVMPASTLQAFAKSLEGIALLSHGRAADALVTLRVARDSLSTLVGADHPSTSLYTFNMALALEALGRYKDALAAVEEAEPALRKAMRRDAPTYIRARELQSRLEKAVASEAVARQGSGSARSGVSRQTAVDFFS